MPSRSERTRLAFQRTMEARALLSDYHADAAFYLAGYSIECALKACVYRKLDQDDFNRPDRSNKSVRYVQERVLREFKTHNYSDLLVLSGLSAKFENEEQANAVLASAWNWIVVMNWTEQSRYESGNKTVQEASDFIEAIKQLLEWISNYW